MNKTKIEWVQNPDGSQGYTWNPITGCLNGCPYCYARRLANSRLKERYLANPNTAIKYQPEASIKEYEHQRTDPFYPRFWPERLRELSNRKQQLMDGEPKPIGVFVCDMSDLFGIGVPEDWTRQVMDMIWDNDEYDRFYLLTKQPQNLIKWSPFPDNCWVGVTVCNDKMLDVAVDKLEDIQAKVKYISFEPLLEHLTLSLDYAFYYSGISWIIIGAQTKPYKPPEIPWVHEIVEAGIPVFLKNNLRDLLVPDALMDDVFWESDKAKLRQEMPKHSFENR